MCLRVNCFTQEHNATTRAGLNRSRHLKPIEDKEMFNLAKNCYINVYMHIFKKMSEAGKVLLETVHLT